MSHGPADSWDDGNRTTVYVKQEEILVSKLSNCMYSNIISLTGFFLLGVSKAGAKFSTAKRVLTNMRDLI